jgi:UDP-galactopyranose mutase
MKVDWLVVGTGFTGCTIAERIASQLGQRVLLVERRDHLGGNAYDEYDENGVLVHKYGPHIFHTSCNKVWGYLSQFTEWRSYEHRVLAVVDGKKVPLPFNLASLHALFPSKCAAKLEHLLIEHYGYASKVPILKLRESSNKQLRFLADYVYEKIFYQYTLKQWELKPEDLDASVTGRVPVHVSWDDRYFQDSYQAMPKLGYTCLFRQMLRHPNIEVLLNTHYKEIMGRVNFKYMVSTGPIDEFFDYVHGELPYRSLRFEFTALDHEWYQEVGTVNYPNDHAFTRITEQKHLSGQTLPKTLLVKEYPQKYVSGQNERYYPIPREENRDRYKTYLKETAKLNGSVRFAGRLGDYKYYNMDQAVARALKLFEEVATQ